MRLCLVGATGLVGRSVIEAAVGQPSVRIVGVSRREMRLPDGARMEMLISDTAGWPDAIAAASADVMVCALGTTMRKAGSKEAFLRVDHDLVVESAQAARSAGIEKMILVSSVGADRASRNFYARTKGEAEAAVMKLGFRRLDILRPGLLRGAREDDPRTGERLAMAASPVLDLLLHGRFRAFRSVSAMYLAKVILALSMQKVRGRFIHDFDGMERALRRAGD